MSFAVARFQFALAKLNPEGLRVMGFEVGDFFDPAEVALFSRKRGAKPGVDDFLGIFKRSSRNRSEGLSPGKAQNVSVVVFARKLSADCSPNGDGPDPLDLIGGNANTFRRSAE